MMMLIVIVILEKKDIEVIENVEAVRDHVTDEAPGLGREIVQDLGIVTVVDVTIEKGEGIDRLEEITGIGIGTGKAGAMTIAGIGIGTDGNGRLKGTIQ